MFNTKKTTSRFEKRCKAANCTIPNHARNKAQWCKESIALQTIVIPVLTESETVRAAEKQIDLEHGQPAMQI